MEGKNAVRQWAFELGYKYGHMTIGECIYLAGEQNLHVGEVVLQEAQDSEGLTRAEVTARLTGAFAHNLRAAEIGRTEGSSFLLGQVGQELSDAFNEETAKTDFTEKVVAYTLAAQVGNHSIGLCPCAGTGDSCPYTGFVKAMLEDYDDQALMVRVMAVIVKIGGIFRVGKTTTGCNMEGIGAGAAALAAAFVELEGGTPAEMEKAITLAISPTIAVPCTPRVLVPGLCATHIGGAVYIARLASRLAMHTSVPSVVPADVMIAMAASCHLESAKHVVPVTIRYMEPFFKHDERVDAYVDESVLTEEKQRQREIITQAQGEIRALASAANPITRPFGDAVVGGSSQGVGSPTNCARLAHHLAKGEVKKVKIELYSELFARRAINVPGILMAALDGAATNDAVAYAASLDEAKRRGVEVEILEIDERSVQRVTIEASEGNSMVDSLNRGGARLVLREAYPSREQALELAKQLNIAVVEK